MTQEEKELLLKDLCTRLPYNVCVHIRYKTGEPCYGKLTPRDIQWFIDSKIENIKPYLRPMSSITEEERDELERICSLYACDNDCNEEYGIVILSDHNIYSENPFEALDWLNKKGFDYRGLIPMDLALEAPKDMYKI